MHRRRELFVFAVTAGVLWVITLCILVVEVVQVVRTPPAQHPEVVLMAIVGDALKRLLWSVGVAAVVVLARIVAGRIRPRLTRKSRRIRHPHFWQARLVERRYVREELRPRRADI